MSKERLVLRADAAIINPSDLLLQNLLEVASTYIARLDELPQPQNRIEETQRGVLKALTLNFIHAAKAYYLKGLKLIENENLANPDYSRRLMIDQLYFEWDYVMGLWQALLLPPGTADTMTVLQHIINRAWNDIALSEHRIAILAYTSHHFKLHRLLYAPGAFIISVPLTSLYSPWNLSIVYHELAAILLYLRGKDLVDSLIPVIPEMVWADWLKNIIDLDPDREITEVLQDIHQDILKNWMVEFIEDAAAILCLGNSMAEELDRILHRYYYEEEKGDTSHPHPRLRHDLAKSLSYHMDANNARGDDPYLFELARALYERRREIVDRVFSAQTDKPEVDRLANELQWGIKGLTAQEVERIPAYILIAATMQAMQGASPEAIRIINDRSRQLLETRLVRHPLPEAVITPDEVIENGAAFLEQIAATDNFGEHLALRFTEVDRVATCEFPNGVSIPLDGLGPGAYRRAQNPQNAQFPNGVAVPLNETQPGIYVRCNHQ